MGNTLSVEVVVVVVVVVVALMVAMVGGGGCGGNGCGDGGDGGCGGDGVDAGRLLFVALGLLKLRLKNSKTIRLIRDGEGCGGGDNIDYIPIATLSPPE